MKKILLTSFIVALGLLGASCKDDNMHRKRRRRNTSGPTGKL